MLPPHPPTRSPSPRLGRPSAPSSRILAVAFPALFAAAAFGFVGVAEAFAASGGTSLPPSSLLCFGGGGHRLLFSVGRRRPASSRVGRGGRLVASAGEAGSDGVDDDERTIVAASLDPKTEATTGSDEDGDDAPEASAKTATVNERLMAELSAAADREKFGKSSSSSPDDKKKKWGLDSFRTRKSEEEIQASIAEARNLNGVNPAVAIGGSLFALGGAAALWTFTEWLGEWFARHPITSDVYAIERGSYVVRNVAMGFASLAAGFFGVTGMGILALGVRVAYGVATGELDPAPLKKAQKGGDGGGEGGLELPNVWDLMMGKKPGRRRR